MTLNPLEEFVIARQLNDPNDAGTYYVRAFVRNAKTDALIATVNLDNKGSQRFTKTWQVPQDPTGLGFFITITSLVYTDSGYTTLSTIYGSEQSEFLVQDRINPYLQGGVASPDINYKKIREIVQEEMAKLVIPEPEKFDYETLAKGLESVILEVKGIKIPETNLRPVLSQLEGLESRIKAIKIPETDLKPVINQITEFQKILKPYTEKITDDSQALLERIKEFFDGDIEKIIKSIEAVQKKLAHVKEVMIETPKKRPNNAILKEYLNGR